MKILLAKIGWGASYDSEDNLLGGGYESGSDRFNFQIASDGRVYGFFPVGKGHNSLNLKRIDKNLDFEDRVDGVTIVWVATRPKTGGQYIVGWYSDATLLAHVARRPDSGHYRVSAEPAMCTLVPLSERYFKIALGVISGQSSVRYYPSGADPQVENEFQPIEDYLRNWHISSVSDSSKAAKSVPEREAEAQLEREQGFQSDAKLRVLIEEYAEKLVCEHFAAKGIFLAPHPKSQWPWDFKYPQAKAPSMSRLRAHKAMAGRFCSPEMKNDLQGPTQVQSNCG